MSYEDYDEDNERIIYCNCDDGSFSFISKEAEIKNMNDEFKYLNNKK